MIMCHALEEGYTSFMNVEVSRTWDAWFTLGNETGDLQHVPLFRVVLEDLAPFKDSLSKNDQKVPQKAHISQVLTAPRGFVGLSQQPFS